MEEHERARQVAFAPDTEDNDGGQTPAAMKSRISRSSTRTSLAPPDSGVTESAHIGVTFVQLEEYLAIQDGLRLSCQTLPLTLVLWILYVSSTFYHLTAFASFQSADSIRNGIESCSYFPDGPDGREVRIKDVHEIAEIMPWIDGAFVPYMQSPGEMQTLLSHVRVEQTRGGAVEQCAGLNDAMQGFYASGCFPAGGVAGEYGPKRQRYELADPVFQPVKANTFQMWLEIQRPAEVVHERVRLLSQQGWVDLNTQTIMLDGLFLNLEAHIYSHFVVSFELHREGLVEPNLLVTPLRGEVFSHWSQIFLDVLFGAVFVVLLYSVVATLILESKGSGVFWVNLHDPYVWLDISLIVVGGIVIIVFYYFVYWLNKFSEQVFALGDMPPYSIAEAPAERKVQAGVLNAEYEVRLVGLLDWFDWYIMVTNWVRFASSIFAMLSIGRFFRGFRGQPRMSVLVQSVLYSGNFIFHFFLLLAFIFFNFALCGYLLFGDELPGWKTPGGAFGRMLLVLFEHFDYNEFHNVAPVSAALWFSAFYILVTLLIVRTLTAAIVFNYMEVRSRLGEPGMGFQKQVWEALKEVMWGRSFDGSQKSIPYDDLLAILSADTDPALLRSFRNLQVDRRLKGRGDLARAEKSKEVTEDYLVSRGCDRATAERLLHQCADWTYSLSSTSSPSQRMLILLARQINFMKVEVESLTSRLERKFGRSEKLIDRIDLKHAKTVALARRVRRAQQLPPGWTAHKDAEGRRFLRQAETGLTSWTLPKHLM